MAANVRPEHAELATKQAGRGVGRFFFHVRTNAGPIFDLYYNHTPRARPMAKGTWFLFREMAPVSPHLEDDPALS